MVNDDTNNSDSETEMKQSLDKKQQNDLNANDLCRNKTSSRDKKSTTSN